MDVLLLMHHLDDLLDYVFVPEEALTFGKPHCFLMGDQVQLVRPYKSLARRLVQLMLVQLLNSC